MSTMNLTLIGMYNYDNTLFDELTLPVGVDKQAFINNLLLKSGEFELLYPSADFMKPAIKLWGIKWAHTFEEWLKGQAATWNPIENYDRYEESTDHDTSSGSGTDGTTVTGGGTTENKVSAFDSSTYQPESYDETSSSSTSNSSTTTSGTADREHSSHIHGNIGVVDAPKMLASFYDIAKWNLLDHMADVFINEFCIQTY